MANSNEKDEQGGIRPRWVVLAAISAFMIMAIFGLIASDNPDGLEKTMEEIGAEGVDSGLISFGDSFSSDLLTMIIGMIIAFAILVGISVGMKRLKHTN